MTARTTTLSVLLVAALAPGIAHATANASTRASELVGMLAQGAVAIPEPGDLALFLLGVTGLIVGRRASRSRTAPPDDSQLDG